MFIILATLVAVSDTVWLGGFVIAAVIIVALLPKRSLSATLGQMSVKLDNVELATNHRTDGGPTLSEEVAEIHNEMKALRMAVSSLHNQNASRLDTLTTDSATHTRQIAAIHVTLRELTDAIAHKGQIDK